jgi:NAD(P)-dependent dehydrogenase (short-subunit alcohol dehydrogenase family)
MGQTVLITGANSGIGRATAELLAGKGYKVYATMRDLEKGRDLADLAKAKGWDLHPIRLDIRDQASVDGALAAVGEVDVLINNAGFEVWGPLEEMTVDDLKDQFETNLFGTFRVILGVLPSMRQRGRGVIVNVSSVAGRLAAPLNGAYAASKFALEALTESLSLEAGHFGVRFHLIEPGLVATDFGAKRRVVGAAAGAESPYLPMVREWEDVAVKQIESGSGGRSSAEDVAKIIVDAVENGEKLRYPAGNDANMILTAHKQLEHEQFIAAMRAQLGMKW